MTHYAKVIQSGKLTQLMVDDKVYCKVFNISDSKLRELHEKADQVNIFQRLPKETEVEPKPDYRPAKSTAPKNASKDGKARPTLIPMDILEKYLTAAYEEGLIKYERESWRRGFVVTEMADAIKRHLKSFLSGEDLDQEALELYGIEKTHLAAIMFCCASALHTLEYHPQLDDRRDPATWGIAQ